MFALKSYLPSFLGTIATGFLVVFLSAFLSLPAKAAELIMVEQNGCEWCERWNDEIGVVYHKTSEGKHAPLRRVDLRAMPESLQVDRRVSFTPTFLIVEDGQERARLEGYPGEDFFWPLLDLMLAKHTNYDPETGTGG